MNNNDQNAAEQVMEAVQEGTMTYVEYINQYDEDVRDEYQQYCKDNGLDPEDEDSAMSFIEYREDEIDANMEN